MSLNIQMIKSSFENVKPVANEAISYFYTTLFSSFPEIKPIFEQVDMEAQKKALIGALVKIVDNLENAEVLTSYLKKMGARHLEYNVTDEHYDMVGKSLIYTFRYFFGSSWTAELEEQWILAYGTIADCMLTGAIEAKNAKETKPANDTKPANETKPANDTKPANATKPANETKSTSQRPVLVKIADDSSVPMDVMMTSDSESNLLAMTRSIAKEILHKAMAEQLQSPELIALARKHINDLLVKTLTEESSEIKEMLHKKAA